MSILSDVITALDGVANGNVYPEAAPQKIALPMVIVLRTSTEPLMLLQGYGGTTKSTFTFECYAADKLAAMTLANQVVAAIRAALAGLPIQYQESVAGEDYEPQIAEYMEPVSFSFWHP